MSTWKAKRFWTEATVSDVEGGFTVLLDGRAVKTPAKAPLVVPTEAMAQAIANEWDAQEGEIAPQSMPVTRAANAAIDKVTVQHTEVADLLAAYGDADLTCYRAEGPESLVARQAEVWDPLLEWVKGRYGASLEPVAGLMHAPQTKESLSKLNNAVHAMDAFTLTAFHDLVGLSGSLVIGLAALGGAWPADELWEMSRVDERWQEEQWGEDEEAKELEAQKRLEFLAAKAFFDLL